MARGAATRDMKKEASWRRHMMVQAESGLAIGAYCRRHGLAGHGFYWWRRELARRDAQKRPAFVPVTVAVPEARPQASWIEIVLPGERQVRVMGPLDRQTLADVLSVLEDRAGQREGRRCCWRGSTSRASSEASVSAGQWHPLEPLRRAREGVAEAN